MWRQLQASLAGAERTSHRLLRQALERDGSDFVLQRSRAHAAMCAAAHPRVRRTDPPFESVHTALAVIKYVHGDDLRRASWREFSNGAAGATVAAALLHDFTGYCTDYHGGASDDGDNAAALPPGWYAEERFQAYRDLLAALRADEDPSDHLERMADGSRLRYLPLDQAFDAGIDRSDGGETSVVFVDASATGDDNGGSGGGSASEVWRVGPEHAARERAVVKRASCNVPVGSYVLTYGRLVSQDNLQVLSSYTADTGNGDEFSGTPPGLQVHVQQKLAAGSGGSGGAGGAAAGEGNASAWDTTPELEEFRRSGGLRAAVDTVLRGGSGDDVERLDALLTVGTCASSEMGTREIIEAGAMPALMALVDDADTGGKASVASFMVLGNMALHPVAVTAFLENETLARLRDTVTRDSTTAHGDVLRRTAVHALLDCANNHPSRVLPHLARGSDTEQLEAQLQAIAASNEPDADALLARVSASRAGGD